MIAAVVADLLGLVAVVAVCSAMLYLAYRIEPHWVAKDEQRFLTVAHDLDEHGIPAGRKHEVRVYLDDDAVGVRQRGRRHRGTSIWTVSAKSPTPPRGRAVYFLKRVTGDSLTEQMALRLPATSKMISHLDERLAATSANAVRRPTGQPTYEPADEDVAPIDDDVAPDPAP